MAQFSEDNLAIKLNFKCSHIWVKRFSSENNNLKVYVQGCTVMLKES